MPPRHVDLPQEGPPGIRARDVAIVVTAARFCGFKKATREGKTTAFFFLAIRMCYER